MRIAQCSRERLAPQRQPSMVCHRARGGLHLCETANAGLASIYVIPVWQDRQGKGRLSKAALRCVRVISIF